MPAKLEFIGEYSIKLVRDGEVIHRQRAESDSLVKNALRWLRSLIANKNETLYNTAGGTFSTSVEESGGTSPDVHRYNWANSIACGESTVAFDINQYNLQALYKDLDSISMTDFVESGTIGYWDETVGIAITDSKTITEIGLFGIANATKFMVARDVLESPVVVQPEDTLAITYKLITKSV